MTASHRPFSLFALIGLCAQAAHASSSELPAAFGPPPGSNPLTWGFYGTHEIQTPVKLPVQGTIPHWLQGSLYRGAAGTWDVGNYTAEHWFDGFSRNHVFNIADGEVTYRSRNGTDELEEFVRETGRVPDGSFGSDPCKIIFGAFEATFRDGNHAHNNSRSGDNVGVSYFPNFPGLARNGSTTGGAFDTMVVTTDGNDLQQIDPVTLEPIEIFTYNASSGALNGTHSAAHPAHGEQGDLYNYVLDTSVTPPAYTVFHLEPKLGKATVLAEIKDAPPAYIHSTFSTENHVVLIIWQADFVKPGKTILSSLGSWNANRKTIFYVIDKVKGGIVSKYISEDAFFAFHEVNSFESTSGDIYIDLPTMNDTHFLTAANVINLRANVGSKTGASSKNDLTGVFTRYKLPSEGPSHSQNGTLLTKKALVDFKLPYKSGNLELPRINQAYSGKPYQYAYGVHVEEVGSFADSLIKVDTKEQGVKIWTPPTKQLPSEPVFISRPGATQEDDGVLLSIAMDSVLRKSSLVVIDAQSMTEIGRAQMPIVMGYGFHGVWGQ